jgi:integrase
MSTRRTYGSGSISYHKDSGLFQGRIDMSHGKIRKRKSVYGKTKRETQLKLNALMTQVEKGSFVDNSAKSLSLWLEDWLRLYKNGKLKPNTLIVYNRLIDIAIRQQIGEIDLKDITPIKLQEFFNGLANEYAPATLQKVKNILKPAFQKAVDNNMLKKNPMAGVELPKQVKPLIHALSENEITRLCEAAKEYRLYSAIVLVLQTGLRIGELLALTWKDFKPSKRMLYINKTLIQVKDEQGSTIKQIQHSTKTDSSNRTIPLNAGAMSILSDHMLDAGEMLTSEKLIFSTKSGNPYDYGNFNRTLASICKKAGIQRITAHSLRHTFATQLHEKGANIKALSEILGHKKATTTLDMYVHPSSEGKEDIVNLLNINDREEHT